ncbi:drug resistance transporter, EmrB/QacA subfamily [Streptomyces sp. 2224.1]|nr:drug resistance transporter, EmrB/QacA subfamily [Streptomyces sp. 2224.1]
MAVNGTREAADRAGGAGRPGGADGGKGTGRPGATAGEAPSGGRSPKSLYLGVFGLLLGMFLAMVDGLIVGTALPTIVGELGGLDQLSWVVTAYLLTTAVATPIWGKAGDLYGRKGTFMAAIGLFLAGSMLSGLAQDMGQLIAFRALQGLGAGGLMVGALSVIGVLVPPRQSGRMQSMIGAMMPVAFIGGPLLGGFLTDHLSWRWAFYVNVPIGVVSLVIVGGWIRLGRTERSTARIDYPGVVLLSGAILALTLLASWGGVRYGWGSPQILGLAAVSVVALAWFVRVERRAVEPVIPPRLFRSRNFTLAQLLSFLIGAVMLGVTSYLPQYLQFVQGLSPTAGGLLLLPLMFGMLGVQLGTGALISRNGRYRIYPILGGGVLTAGVLVLLLLGRETTTALASGLTVVAGMGIGFVMQSTMLITMNSAEPRDMGAASGTVTLLRTVGGSLGVALLGAVFTGRLHSGLADRLGEGAAGRLTARGGQLTPRALDGLAAPVREAYRAAVTGGLHGVLAGAAVLAVLGFAAAWFVREAPLRSTVEPDGPATPHSPAEPTGPAHPHSPENAHSPAKPRP